MRPLPLAAVVLAAAVLAAGCELEPEAAPAAPPVTVTETAPPPAAKSGPTVPPSSPSPSPSVAKKVRVPRVVGLNHQVAQDRMQAAGLFKLVEEDATGLNRLLLWDRNWVVVKQSPRAGKTVTEDATIILYSKKIGE